MKYYQYHFKEKFGYEFDGDMDDLLKFAKKRMLSMIFAKPSIYKFEQFAFAELFPKVLKFINEFKQAKNFREDNNKKLAYNKRHKKLAYFSFQFEAKVVIDKIAREFDKLHKGKVPVFTLHDCILTDNSHLEELKEFMKNKFIEMFDDAPNLTVGKSSLNEGFSIAC